MENEVVVGAQLDDAFHNLPEEQGVCPRILKASPVSSVPSLLQGVACDVCLVGGLGSLCYSRKDLANGSW